MKRLWIVLLAALLLTGCAPQALPGTQPPETTLPAETTVPTEPLPSFYIQNSPMERGTGGAVRQYEMEGQVTGLSMFDGKLLLCTDNRKLWMLDSETMAVLRSRELEQELNWDDESLLINERGVAWYDSRTKSYITLDNNLNIAPIFTLDVDMIGQPVISSTMDRIYYATSEGLEVTIPADGTSRRLREEHGTILSLDGLLFEDEILVYTRQNALGEAQKCFISVADGSLRDAVALQGQIHTWKNQYSCVMTFNYPMGQVTWLLTGDKSGNQQRLSAPKAWEDALLLDNGLAVLQSSSKVGVTLYCYSLSEGALLSSVLLPEQYELFTLACPEGDKIWLCDGTGSRFFCWDTTATPAKDSPTEFVPGSWLAAGTPADKSLYQPYLDRIGETFGIDLTLEERDNRTPGINYGEYPDLRPTMYNLALTELEKALQALPEGFLKKVGSGANSRKISITLVDRFDPAVGTIPASGSADVSGGEIRLELNICPEIKEIFWHELFHVMDVQILNESDGMNHWEELNPEDFTYVSTYSQYYSGELKDSEYLLPGSNYFADAYSMLGPREDRAQVFVYAMMPEQAFRFSSPAMGKKLELICDMIRQRFDIPKDTVPRWEQYTTGN